MQQLSERAVLARVNRKLAHEGQRVYRNSPLSPWVDEQGRFYLLDKQSNTVKQTHINLNEFAERIGVIGG